MEDLQAFVNSEYIREKMGYEDGGDIISECRECSKPLFRIVQILEDNPVIFQGNKELEILKQKFISNCPYCKSTSWVVKVGGTVIYDGIEEKTQIVDLETEIDDNHETTTYLEVLRT